MPISPKMRIPAIRLGSIKDTMNQDLMIGENSKRYQRYKTVVDFLACRPRFDAQEVLEACDEKKAFVTKVVRELESTGWVVRDLEPAGYFSWNPGRTGFSTDRWLKKEVFSTQIKTAPVEQRPRERLLAHGAESLTTAELLAILIRTGRPGESAMMAGDKLAREFTHRLESLPDAGREELKMISPAVHSAAWCQIMAGIELGRRVASFRDDTITKRISSTQEAVDFCQRHFARMATDARQEEFHIVSLDTKNQVIDTHQITIGTLDASLVHPREVFRAAIRDAASSIILVHNHPSGDPEPSREDISVTRRLEQCGETLGIRILDHIIVASRGTCSIREHGI